MKEGRLRALLRNPYAWGFVAGVVLVTASVPLFRQVPDPPPVLRTPAPWTLEDARGAASGSKELEGSVALVALAAPGCAAECAPAAVAMRGLQERFALMKAPVALVTILTGATTPADRAAWERDHGAREGAWRAVGSADAATSCGTALALRARTVTTAASDPCAAAHALAHGGILVLVDRSGAVRGEYPVAGLGLDEAFHLTLAVLDED